jgi:4-alpha-glucanotransferase
MPMGERRPRETTDATRVAILTTMGFEADDEAAATRSLGKLDEEERERPLEPTRVVFEDEKPRFLARWVPDSERTIPTEFEIEEEDGTVHERSARAHVGQPGRLTGARLPRLPAGVHRLRAILHDPAGPREGEQTLVVAPRRCLTVAELLGKRRAFALWTNLYTVRSGGDIGFGNLSSLRKLVQFAGEVGADFVGINPLHALRNRGNEISPYLPVSRIFRSPLYLDVRAVPEFETSPDARSLLESEGCRREIEALRQADRLDYARIAAVQRRILEVLHRRFLASHRGQRGARDRAYADYCARHGDLLTNFATFQALEEDLARSGMPRNWHIWPAELRNPRSGAVQEFRSKHSDVIDFWRFVQFELDRQLEAASREGQVAGLPIGLYQDLAVGSAASGFDTWAFPGLFLDGLRMGAPPDDYAAAGQDWGFPPLDPHKLAADGYRYWIQVLRAALAHSGAIRIDHVMGLFRQYWVPFGSRPTEGAYVRFPAQELLALLAVESRRQGALVIGEDLGTVPRGLPSQLARWGVVSSRVLLFEQDSRGTFRSASQYSRRALATVNTHDLPTLPDYWAGSDLELRHELGLLSEEALTEARVRRDLERGALLRRLAADKCLPSRKEPDSYGRLCAAVNSFLCRTPAPLVGLSLDDLAGETGPVNIPGVPPERFPSWTRRMRLSLEALPRDETVKEALTGAARRSRRPR